MGKQNGIQRTQQTDIQKLTEDSKIDELGSIVKHVNQLIQFPLSVEQIEDWCKSLIHLLPNLDRDALIFLINQMKLGNYEYDRNVGIQNITKGLAKIKKNSNGYYIDHSDNYY